MCWYVSVRADGVGVAAGRQRDPDITFTQDAATAAAIQSGGQSAQAAFMSGRLRVGGDVRVLLDHQDDLVASTTCSPRCGPPRPIPGKGAETCPSYPSCRPTPSD